MLATTATTEDNAWLVATSADVCEAAFAAVPDFTVSEWADANRRLTSEVGPITGKFRTDAAPYMRRVQDVQADDTVREVTFCKSAQIGGSTAGENFDGYVMDVDPSPALVVWPTDKLMQRWSTIRLENVIRETPSLAARFPRTRRRERGNTIARKDFPGGFIQGFTAKSAADLRSITARRARAEEIDEWVGDVGGQGDPLELLRTRLRNYWNSLLFKVSTPTLDGFSRIWSELQQSSWEEYWVPCPHCSQAAGELAGFQVLRWRDGEDDDAAAGDYRLLWEADADGEPIPGTCRYVCEHCACEIDESAKQWMLINGQWRARYPHRTEHIGFHINTLYSPFSTWYEMAKAWRRAIRSGVSGLKEFVNLWLGLPYKEGGAKIDPDSLSARAESYGAEVPHGVGLLTAGVDIQGDRIEVFVWGWGEGLESWFIAWEVLEGDPARPDVWKQLRALLKREWVHASGATLTIKEMAIDTGYMTSAAFAFCDANQRCMPIKGDGGPGKPMLREPRLTQKRRDQKRPTWMVGTDEIKNELASRLRSASPGSMAVHFPRGLDGVFYDQLTAEKLKLVRHKRRLVRTWDCPDGRANEATDGAVYARAALRRLEFSEPKLLRTLGDRAKALSDWKPPTEPVAPKQKQKARPPKQPWATGGMIGLGGYKP